MNKKQISNNYCIGEHLIGELTYELNMYLDEENLHYDEVKDTLVEITARNVCTNGNTLGKLADSDNYVTRAYVAGNPSTPNRILEKLAKDEDFNVKISIARNLNITKKLLNSLLKENSDSVCMKYEIARNKNASAYILTKLAKDKDENVRKGVAENPNIPLYNIFDDLSKDKSWVIRYALAKNNETPSEVLEDLLMDKSKKVKEAAEKTLSKLRLRK